VAHSWVGDILYAAEIVAAPFQDRTLREKSCPVLVHNSGQSALQSRHHDCPRMLRILRASFGNDATVKSDISCFPNGIARNIAPVPELLETLLRSPLPIGHQCVHLRLLVSAQN